MDTGDVRLRRYAMLGAAMCILALIVGIVSTRASSAGSSLTEKRQASEERLRNGLVFKPVEQTIAATVAATDAWETVKREYPEFSNLSELPVEGTLALVTTEGHGKTAPDGSVTPKYKDRLAWVLTIRDVEVFPLIGGIPGGGERAERPKLTGCVTRFLVDAVDGSYGGAWQSCKPA